MKYFFVVFLFLISSYAEALPLPEFVSAGFGIGEFIFLLLGLIGIAFPFIRWKKFKAGTIVLSILLLISLYFNLQSFLPPTIVSSDEQEHPFMKWSEEQRQHDPYAFDEKRAFDLIEKKDPNYLFIDARTRAETELGTAQGFTIMNWVDLATLHKDEIKNKKVVVTCWTGMRGSEICSKLRQLGIDCQYLKGGLEAWRKLGLPVILKPGVALSDFGTQQPIMNMNTYFSYQQLLALQKEHVPIIDIRAEKYYQQKHIPDSINIAFDDLSSSDLQYKIQTLPPSLKGYVVACFGLVSCSEAPSFGWELEQFGGKYLGSYAGGFQSFDISKEPPFYQKIIVFLSHYFNYLKSYLSQNFVILFIGIILGINLWLTKYLSFDYFKQRKSIKDKEKQISLYYDDIVVQRERKQHFLSHLRLTLLSVTPIIFVFIYIVLFEALSLSFSQSWSMTSGYSFFTLISSLLFTLSIALSLSKQKYSFHNPITRCITYGLIFILSFVSIALFSYFHVFIFLLSYFVMLSIDFIPFIYHKIITWCCICWFNNKGYISLRFARYIIKHTKASELAQLLNNGFSIPSGWIISPNCRPLPKLLFQAKHPWIVRSTALNEDQQQSSQAGLFLSLINHNKKVLAQDIKKVFLSYHSKSLSKEVVLVQELINAKFAGVMFSQNPQCGGTTLIEWGEGLANKRMEGSENTYRVVLNQKTGELLTQPPVFSYYPALFLLLKRLEQIYKKNIDVEWVIDEKNKIWIVQVRPQTNATFTQLPFFNQTKQELAEKPYYLLKTNELSMLMKSCTPLSASLITNLWKNSSSMDKASRRALWQWKGNIEIPDYYTYFAGQLWVADYSILQQPNRLLWCLAKKEYQQNRLAIEKETQLLLLKIKPYHAINWNLLTTTEVLHIWKELKEFWKIFQSYSFYFELMLSQSMTDDTYKNSINKIEGSTILELFYRNKLNFHALQEYESSCPRYQELEDSCELNIKEIVSKTPTSFISQLIFYRELYKYYGLELFYLMRQIILFLKQKHDFIYFLTEDELHLLIDNENQATQIAQQRMIEQEFYSTLVLPKDLNLNQALQLGYIQTKENNKSTAHKKGEFVSKAQSLHGIVINFNNKTSKEIELLLEQQTYKNIIIYSAIISPQVVELTKQIIEKNSNVNIALCSLYGSVLSHSSILAREYQIPFIIHLDLGLYEGMEIIINKQGFINN